MIGEPVRRFFTRNGAREDLSPIASENLARSIGADESEVVGGTIQRGPNGEFFTNENSGHYGQNWTLEIRIEFQKWLRSRVKKPVDHQTWSGQ